MQTVKFSLSPSQPRSRRRSRTPDETESLEVRTMLSNVNANFQNGDLRITGDAGNNFVDITQTPSGFIVRGLDGTGINGRPPNGGAFLATNEPVDDVDISFAAGGTNMVLLRDLDVRDDLVVRGGQQRDRIGVVNGNVGDDVKIRSQSGNDLILLQLGSADTININTGNGTDKVALVSLPPQTTANKLTIKTGHGDDGVFVDGFDFSGNVSVNTGSGDDAVLVRNSQLNRGLRVNLSSGDDDFYITTSRVAGRANVNGGSGVDHAQLFVNPIRNYNPRSIEGNVVADAQTQISVLLGCAFNGFPIDDGI